MEGFDEMRTLKALFYPDVPFETLFIPHIYKEIYFENVYSDVFNQNRNMIIIDVGANIGIVTGYMRDYAKKVYAIEPSSEHFEALEKNKEFNNWDNVEIFKVAIADRDGEMRLNKNEDNRTMHSLTTDFSQDNELVGTMAMDTFFNRNNIENIDFIKFDVEGAEELILRSEGFKKIVNKIKAIEIEFHSPFKQELVEYVMSFGYQAKKILSSANIVLFRR